MHNLLKSLNLIVWALEHSAIFKFVQLTLFRGGPMLGLKLNSPKDDIVINKDFSNNQDRKCWMKCCLIHEMFGYVYAHLVLEVGLRDFTKSFNISYLYIENFW